jgi:hypothetical protein
VRLSSFLASAGAGVAFTAAFFVAAPGARYPAAAATPPPTPPPIANPATPLPAAAQPEPSPTLFPNAINSPTPAPNGKASARPSPPPNARKGLDGVWEVQIQHANFTDYTHFKITQQGDALSGTYLDAHNKKYPIAGTVDSGAVRLIVTMPDGTTLLLEGKLDGTTDMVGMLTSVGGTVPFTASYRAKEKWIENVNPSPGGIQQPGTYTPP